MKHNLKSEAILNLQDNDIKNQEIINQIVRNLTFTEKNDILQNVIENPQASKWLKDNIKSLIF